MDFTAFQIQSVLLGVFILVISVALHEFGHAYMADRLGDDTPRRQGRVTLNPLAHADPIGTLLLPLIGGLYGGGSFGWGKPVQWQPHRIRRGIRMATASILVSFAGPFMNLVLTTLVTLVHVILVSQNAISLDVPIDELGHIKGMTAHLCLTMGAVTNFILFFFNLLPVPPLDGGHIATAFMPSRHRRRWESVAKYGPIIVLAFLLIPQFQRVFVVPAMWCAVHLYGAIGSLFGM